MAKIARFNSVNSEIIGQKFAKFIHYVAGLFPFNLLKGSFTIGQSIVEHPSKE